MTKEEEFKGKVKIFYKQSGSVKLEDVVAVGEDNRRCQLCGNRHLKKLCHIRNGDGKDWFIGWDCYTALEELQSREMKRHFNEMIKCSKCGNEQRRGELTRGAEVAGLCKKCWMAENNIPAPEPQQWNFPSEVIAAVRQRAQEVQSG